MGEENIEAGIANKAPFPLRMNCVVNGHEYALGSDWLIRVGSFRRGNTIRGLVLEVCDVFCVDTFHFMRKHNVILADIRKWQTQGGIHTMRSAY